MPSLGSLQGFQIRLIFFFSQRGKQDRFVKHFRALDKCYCESKRFRKQNNKETVCSFCIIFYIITSASPKVFPSAEPRCFELWLSFFFFLRKQYLRTFPFLPIFVRAVNNEYSQVGENNLEMHKGSGIDRNPDAQIVLMSLCFSLAHKNTNLKNTSHYLNFPIFIQLCHAQSNASTSTNRDSLSSLSAFIPPTPLFCKGHLLLKGNPVSEEVWVVE